MRILFITTKHPEKQGDLLEVSLLHGLRTGAWGRLCWKLSSQENYVS